MMTENTGNLSGAEKLLNVGVVIRLKKFGEEEIRVRDLTLEQIVTLVSDVTALLETMTQKKEGQSGIDFLGSIIGTPETVSAARKIAAAVTGKTAEDFANMGLTDWLKVALALRTAVDWEELRSVFFQLAGPRAGDLLRGLPQTVQGD